MYFLLLSGSTVYFLCLSVGTYVYSASVPLAPFWEYSTCVLPVPLGTVQVYFLLLSVSTVPVYFLCLCGYSAGVLPVPL